MRHTPQNVRGRRRRKRFPLPKDSDRDVVISGDTGPLDRLIAQQHNRGLRQVVRRELAKLPAAQQVALRQFHFDGKSVGEIALSLREPVQTIHSRLRRARGALGRSRVLHRWWQDVRDLQSS